MNSILLVRTSAIGDVIQTLPVLEYLSRKFPGVPIDWVVEKGIAPLLEQIEPDRLNRVLIVDTKKWAQSPCSFETLQEMRQFYRSLRSVHYDLLFDLQGNTKSGAITWAARAKEKVGFGSQSVREKTNLWATTTRYDLPLELNIRRKYLGLAQKHFNDPSEFVSSGLFFRLLPDEKHRLEVILEGPLLQKRMRWMVAVGSKWENKRLKEETLLAFLTQVAEKHDPSFLFIYGSPEEEVSARKLQDAFADRSESIGDLSLPLWQALMWKMDGVIAVDSAALHLAGTTQTPTFSIFGPTTASIFKPMEDRHHTHQGSCPYGRTFLKQCPILRTCPTGACIREISSEALFSSFDSWNENCKGRKDCDAKPPSRQDAEKNT